MISRTLRLKQMLSPTRRPGVVVASFGRSGSTLLYHALAKSMSEIRFGRHRQMVYDTAWNLAETPPRRGLVTKTHDYPTALAGRDDLRSVFLFGSAVDAARSVITQMDREGPDWVKLHLTHLKASGPFDAILERDILGLSAQFDAWSGFTESPVLCVHYEALWDEIDSVADFAGLPVALPPRRARKSARLPAEQEAALARVYGPIDARIASYPRLFRPGEVAGQQLL